MMFFSVSDTGILGLKEKSDCTRIFLLRVCPGEDQAGGDNAQITDLAQTWHKC